jgi:hypothetical protein
VLASLDRGWCTNLALVQGLVPGTVDLAGDSAHYGPVTAAGYESWFISARDPAAPRALWIRHTRLRPVAGPESSALWCTVLDHSRGRQPVVIKEAFNTFPRGAAAGPGRFAGAAAMGGQHASWELAITGGLPPLRPLRPAALYRAPLPRTKFEASVPDGLVTGVLEVGGAQVEVDRWRGTVGHNWGTEHADRWVWLHAAGFDGAPDSWMELVLARIKAGPLQSPWVAMGALSLGGEVVPLGGLGRRHSVSADPGRLVAGVSSGGGRLLLTVTVAADEAAVVSYADPSGGTRLVVHSALATVRLKFRRRGYAELLSGPSGAYEYGTSRHLPGLTPRSLPDG